MNISENSQQSAVGSCIEKGKKIGINKEGTWIDTGKRE